jgi:hypothetical protein
MIKRSQRFATPCLLTLLAIGLGAGAAPDAKSLSSRPRSATLGARLFMGALVMPDKRGVNVRLNHRKVTLTVRNWIRQARSLSD